MSGSVLCYLCSQHFQIDGMDFKQTVCIEGVVRIDGSGEDKRIEETSYLLVKEGEVGDITVSSFYIYIHI